MDNLFHIVSTNKQNIFTEPGGMIKQELINSFSNRSASHTSLKSSFKNKHLHQSERIITNQLQTLQVSSESSRLVCSLKTEGSPICPNDDGHSSQPGEDRLGSHRTWQRTNSHTHCMSPNSTSTIVPLTLANIKLWLVYENTLTISYNKYVGWHRMTIVNWV